MTSHIVYSVFYLSQDGESLSNDKGTVYRANCNLEKVLTGPGSRRADSDEDLIALSEPQCEREFLLGVQLDSIQRVPHNPNASSSCPWLLQGSSGNHGNHHQRAARPVTR